MVNLCIKSNSPRTVCVTTSQQLFEIGNQNRLLKLILGDQFGSKLQWGLDAA